MPSPVNLSLSFLSRMSQNLMDFIAIQKQSLCLFPPVSIHGQSQILTDLITISARLPSQPNTHFQDCGKGHYLVGVKATTRVGSMPLQREFINFNSGIERNALIEKESSIDLNNLSLIGRPTCGRYSKLWLCYQLATYCRTHAYGFTALGESKYGFEQLSKQIEKHELGQKELNQLWLQTYLEALV